MAIRLLAQLTRNERGATAIEYGLIAALIVIAMMVGLNNFADSTNVMYNRVSNALDEAIT